MSIAHRADGRWIVRYKDGGGTWRQKTFRTEQEARAWEADTLARACPAAQRLSLGELAMLYFRSRPDMHRETKKGIVSFLAGRDTRSGHVEGAGEFLRDTYAESLTRQDLERMREALRARGAGNGTINKYQAYIRAILAWGVDQDLIHRNPWRDYKRLKHVRPVIQPRVEDLRRLFPQLPEWLQWAVRTAFFLALRPGRVELFSLTWDAFNFRRGLVFVRQGKSGRLKTVVPPPRYMAEAEERCRADMAAGIPWVCHRGDGKRVVSCRTAWRLANERAGVSLRFYDVRHIAATEMLARGADLAAVAAQLGHASVATTGAHYAHVTIGSQARAAALMPALDAPRTPGGFGAALVRDSGAEDATPPGKKALTP